MKVFVYEEAGRICVGTMTDELGIVESASLSVPRGSEYLILNDEDLPREPQESWRIEDGVIIIDQEKLSQFNRTQMPTLSPVEFDVKLIDAGLYDQVQELIQSDVKLKIAYTRATFFSRTDPFIDQASEALGLTPERVDMIWTS